MIITNELKAIFTNNSADNLTDDGKLLVKNGVEAAIKEHDINSLYYFMYASERYNSERIAYIYARNCFNEIVGENEAISFPRPIQAHWNEDKKILEALQNWEKTTSIKKYSDIELTSENSSFSKENILLNNKEIILSSVKDINFGHTIDLEKLENAFDHFAEFYRENEPDYDRMQFSWSFGDFNPAERKLIKKAFEKHTGLDLFDPLDKNKEQIKVCYKPGAIERAVLFDVLKPFNDHNISVEGVTFHYRGGIQKEVFIGKNHSDNKYYLFPVKKPDIFRKENLEAFVGFRSEPYADFESALSNCINYILPPDSITAGDYEYLESEFTLFHFHKEEQKAIIDYIIENNPNNIIENSISYLEANGIAYDKSNLEDTLRTYINASKVEDINFNTKFWSDVITTKVNYEKLNKKYSAHTVELQPELFGEETMNKNQNNTSNGINPSLSTEIPRVIPVISSKYEELYNDKTGQSMEIMRIGSRLFDKLMENNLVFKDFINQIAAQRRDAITSDREAAAALIAIKEIGLTNDLGINADDIPELKKDIGIYKDDNKKKSIRNIINSPDSIELVAPDMDDSAILMNYKISKNQLKDIFIQDELDLKHLADKDDAVNVEFKIFQGDITSITLTAFKEDKKYNLSYWNHYSEETHKLLLEELKNCFKTQNNGIDFTQNDWMKTFKEKNIEKEPEIKSDMLDTIYLNYREYACRKIKYYDQELYLGESKLNEDINDLYEGEKQGFVLNLDLIKEAQSIDESIYAFVDKDILTKSDEEIINYMQENGIDLPEIKMTDIRNNVQNFVLDKLAKAGIEVVTDKNEFERILLNDEVIQKMSSVNPNVDKLDPMGLHRNQYGGLTMDFIRKLKEKNISQKNDYNSQNTDSMITHESIGNYGFYRNGHLYFNDYSMKYPIDYDFFITESKVYGFAYNNKIYLNPELMNSEVAIHEYTHLWDRYIQNTNKPLWEKGKEIFKQTYLWEEVRNNPDYQDIADDEDLLLSECHARITGKIATEILEKIAAKNDENLADAVINWDKEVFEYCQKEFGLESKELSEFISMTMKDFMSETKITIQNSINTPEIEFLPSNTDYLERWENKDPSLKKGLFILKDKDRYIAIDNSEGEAWTEEFGTLHQAVIYQLEGFDVEKINKLTPKDMLEILTKHGYTADDFAAMSKKLDELNNSVTVEQNRQHPQIDVTQLPTDIENIYNLNKFIKENYSKYSTDKNADNYVVSAFLNPIMVYYANKGNEDVFNKAQKIVDEYLENFIDEYQFVENSELIQKRRDGVLDRIGELALRQRIEYSGRRNIDPVLEWRPTEQIKYASVEMLKDFKNKYSWDKNFFENSEGYKELGKIFSSLVKDYNKYNASKTLADDMGKELAERNRIDNLSDEDLEKEVEKALTNGQAIYFPSSDNNYKALRLTPQGRNTYAVYGYAGNEKIEKLTKYKISNEIRDALKNHSVLEILSKYDFEILSIESPIQAAERVFNDDLDKIIVDDIGKYLEEGHSSPEIVDSVVRNLKDATYPAKITYRDVYKVLSKNSYFEENIPGPDLYALLKTDNPDILDAISNRMYNIWKENSGGNFLRIPHDHSEYGEAPNFAGAFNYVNPKVIKMELADETDKTVIVNGKKYFNEKGIVYSSSEFIRDCFFVAKDSETGRYATLHMSLEHPLEVIESDFDSYEEAVIKAKRQWHPAEPLYYKESATNAEKEHKKFIYDELAKDKSLFEDDFYHEVKDSRGNHLYRNSHTDELIHDSLIAGKYLTSRMYSKSRYLKQQEIADKSLFLESQIPDRHRYVPEEEQEAAEAQYEKNKALMLNEFKRKNIELPCIIFGYKEGYQYDVPELIYKKIYSVKEFDQIISEADLKRHEKYLGYDKSDVYIVDKDGDVHYERYDIGDGDGGLIARLQHGYDYQMKNGYEKYWNKNSVSEEEWKTYREFELNLLNELKEAVSKDLNKHLNLRNENKSQDISEEKWTPPIWDTQRYVLEQVKNWEDVTKLHQPYQNMYKNWFKELTHQELYAGNEKLLEKIEPIVEVLEIKDSQGNLSGRKGIITKVPNGYTFYEALEETFENPIIYNKDGVAPTLEECEKELAKYLEGHNIDGLSFNVKDIEQNLRSSNLTAKGLDEIGVFLKNLKKLESNIQSNSKQAITNLVNDFNASWGSNFTAEEVSIKDDKTSLDSVYRWSNQLYKSMLSINQQLATGISINDYVIGSEKISLDQKVELLKKDFQSLILPSSPYIVPMPDVKKREFILQQLADNKFETSDILKSLGKTVLLDAVEESICMAQMDGRHTKEDYISAIKKTLYTFETHNKNNYELSHLYTTRELDREVIKLDHEKLSEDIFDFYNTRFSIIGWNNNETWNTSSLELIEKHIPEQFEGLMKYLKDYPEQTSLIKNRLFHYAYEKEYYPNNNPSIAEISAAWEETKNIHFPEIPHETIPYVVVQWSENDMLIEGGIYSLKEFDKLTEQLDAEHNSNTGLYNKTKYTIILPDNETYTDRIDLGDGNGGLLKTLEGKDIKDKILNLISEKTVEEVRQNDNEIIKRIKEEYKTVSTEDLNSYLEKPGISVNENLVDEIIDRMGYENWPIYSDDAGNVYILDADKKLESDSQSADDILKKASPEDIIEITINLIKDDLSNNIHLDDLSKKNKTECLKELELIHKQYNQEKVPEQKHKDFVQYDNIPDYAVSYLMYNDASGLDEADIQLIDKFMEENKLGQLISVEEEYGFSNNPAFGKPCNVIQATFNVLSEEYRKEQKNGADVFNLETNPLFKDFSFDFAYPVTWHNNDNSSVTYADNKITQEQAKLLYKLSNREGNFNPDMAYCIQYRCTSKNKENLIYLCKSNPLTDITSPEVDVELPEQLIKRVMKGVEDGIIKHKAQHHRLQSYLYEATGIAAPVIHKPSTKQKIFNHSFDKRENDSVIPVQDKSCVYFEINDKNIIKIKPKENFSFDDNIRNKLRSIGFKFETLNKTWTLANTTENKNKTLNFMREFFPVDFESYKNEQSNRLSDAIKSNDNKKTFNLNSIENSAAKLFNNIRMILDYEQQNPSESSFNNKPYSVFIYLYKNANMIERHSMEKMLPAKDYNDKNGNKVILSKDEYAKIINEYLWKNTFPEKYKEKNLTNSNIVKDKDDKSPSLS